MTAALVFLALLVGLYAGYATSQWVYWREEAHHYRRKCLDATRCGRPEFIKTQGISEALAEIDRVRAEIARETGIDNVIPVDFGARR